jgi:hypothetical protein
MNHEPLTNFPKTSDKCVINMLRLMFGLLLSAIRAGSIAKSLRSRIKVSVLKRNRDRIELD